MLCSDWTIPTIASTWMIGTAALHLSPSTTLTKSGATTIRPSSDGTASAPTSRTARTHASAIRSRLVLHPGERRAEDLLHRARDPRERARA